MPPKRGEKGRKRNLGKERKRKKGRKEFIRAQPFPDFDPFFLEFPNS